MQGGEEGQGVGADAEINQALWGPWGERFEKQKPEASSEGF